MQSTPASVKAGAAFKTLFELVQTLRSKDGCPWDRAQTPLTMRGPLIEEAFETVDALTEQDALHAKEELGDLFFNAALTAFMFQEEKNGFSIESCLNQVVEKLIRRHPHVFAKESDSNPLQEDRDSAQKINKKWDEIKENVEGRKTKFTLDSVPKNFPPLLKACKFQKKAAKKGFDWENHGKAKQKLLEELDEVQEVISEKSPEQKDRLEEECGDLLFATVNYVQKLGIDPVVALNRANKKFYNRFSFVERQFIQEGIPMEKSQLSKMEEYWQKAKLNIE